MQRPLRTLASTYLPHALLQMLQRTRLFLRGIVYFGQRHHCPCCGWNIRTFLPGGDQQRSNAQCPRCASLERHRLLWLYFAKRTNLFSAPLRVLHIAPESTFQRRLRSSTLKLDYLSVDLHDAHAMMNVDIMALPFPDATFDVILANHVLEHVEDDRKAMKELARVLRNSGWAILQSPIDETREQTFEDPSILLPEERERVFGQSDHVRIYGTDYRERLAEAGFTVTVQDYATELGERAIQRFGLLCEEKIYFCTKGAS